MTGLFAIVSISGKNAWLKTVAKVTKGGRNSFEKHRQGNQQDKKPFVQLSISTFLYHEKTSFLALVAGVVVGCL
ncbi:MAG: hypothetical protein SFV22_18005 [Saprospiraceae bacterium]|nr:hypothetical protein [Saprospiraceae bacterium]